MRSSMVAPPKRSSRAAEPRHVAEHLAEHLAAEHLGAPSPARCAVLAEGATLHRGHAGDPRERPCSRDAYRGAHTRP